MRRNEMERGADARLIAYLDRLSEPLERTLGEEDLRLFRLQTLGHLEMQVAELVEDGYPSDQAVARAVREYGPPDLLAIDFLDEWCKGSRPAGFARGARSATLWAFVFFGLGSAVSLTAMTIVAMVPGMTGFAHWAMAVSWAAPLGAGIATGVVVPTGNLRAVCFALMVVTLHSFLVSELMSSYREGFAFTFAQAVLWPPLGCAATYLTALLRRRPRFPRETRVAI